MKILVANVGSTSFKFKLYTMPEEIILAAGKVENIGTDNSCFSFSCAANRASGSREFRNYQQAISACTDFLINKDNRLLTGLHEIDAVGFKTVHGKNMRECRVLNDQVLQAMEEYNFLAPAHNPPYIQAIKAFTVMIPGVPCVGLFEPAFHRTIPDYAYTTGLPYKLAEKHGIRKYGFHGASHRYIAERTPQFTGLASDKNRIISCHLGGSSSICAIKNGKSVDTSMSFSPQSGLLNANRCGDLDPFIPLYLQKAENMSVDEVAELLQSQSGLAGIAGQNKDVKQIEDAALQGDERAILAMKTYCYRVQQYIGAYYVTLGGCDVLVLTGGIGEKSAPFRREICNALDCIGIQIDTDLNNTVNGEALISSSASQVKVAVIPTNEEVVVAREVQELLEKNRRK
ncbi:MAG TPA: acetate/propionate family kinase [bacterium]|nr:acetate/propionate family kinase [bacterium]HPN45356.1 acetate/propionate family kinase [bacterium]